MQLIGKNLYADEDKWLYQVDDHKLFYKSISLAKEDNIKYFEECTNSEKEEWEKEWSEKMGEVVNVEESEI